MADAQRRLAELDKEFDRDEEIKNDAWSQLGFYKDQLQRLEALLQDKSLTREERFRLEGEKRTAENKYIKYDEKILDIQKKGLLRQREYQVLRNIELPNREELLYVRKSLESRIEDMAKEFSKTADSRIARAHYSKELSVLLTELDQVKRDLGEAPSGGPSDLTGRDLADDGFGR